MFLCKRIYTHVANVHVECHYVPAVSTVAHFRYPVDFPVARVWKAMVQIFIESLNRYKRYVVFLYRKTLQKSRLIQCNLKSLLFKNYNI